MARTNPHVISARINTLQLAAIRRAAADRQESVAQYTAGAISARQHNDHAASEYLVDQRTRLMRSTRGIAALSALVDSPDGPKLDALLAALGLKPDASPEEILAAVQAVLASVPAAAPPPAADPMMQAPEAPPAKLAAVTPPGRPHGAGDPRPLSPVHQQMAKAAGVSPYEMQRLLAANPVPRSPAKVPGRPTPKKA